jgi:hypothetical protein
LAAAAGLAQDVSGVVRDGESQLMAGFTSEVSALATPWLSGVPNGNEQFFRRDYWITPGTRV